MRHPHCRFGLVDMLSAGAARTQRIDLEIGIVDSDIERPPLPAGPQPWRLRCGCGPRLQYRARAVRGGRRIHILAWQRPRGRGFRQRSPYSRPSSPRSRRRFRLSSLAWRHSVRTCGTDCRQTKRPRRHRCRHEFPVSRYARPSHLWARALIAIGVRVQHAALPLAAFPLRRSSAFPDLSLGRRSGSSGRPVRASRRDRIGPLRPREQARQIPATA